MGGIAWIDSARTLHDANHRRQRLKDNKTSKRREEWGAAPLQLKQYTGCHDTQCHDTLLLIANI